MKSYPIETIVSLARSLSPYYRELYKEIPDKGWKLPDLPPVIQKDFWEHNTVDDNRLLTGDMSDGIIFKSGGTTGKPKFSVYSREEWETMTGTFGLHLAEGGLEKEIELPISFMQVNCIAAFFSSTIALSVAP